METLIINHHVTKYCTVVRPLGVEDRIPFGQPAEWVALITIERGRPLPPAGNAWVKVRGNRSLAGCLADQLLSLWPGKDGPLAIKSLIDFFVERTDLATLSVKEALSR